MKKTPKNSIAVVTLYDWQGLYVNGELKLEGASTINTDIIKVLGWEVHYHYPGGLPKTKCPFYNHPGSREPAGPASLSINP